MDHRFDLRIIPPALGVLTLVAVVLLFVDDAAPRLVPAPSHDSLAAFALATIGAAGVIFQLINRRGLNELTKAMLLAAAFLFWAANQLWPRLAQAGLFNDIAIALFVLDVFLVISGRPAASKAGVFGKDSQPDPGVCAEPYDRSNQRRRAGNEAVRLDELSDSSARK